MKFRKATNADWRQIADLIERVYHEYGETLCLDDADRDLLDIESYYFKRGGYFWVLESESGIVGSHAAHPSVDAPTVCTFRRLYLDQELRGQDWGRQLMQITIDWAIENAFRKIAFWSDTRFARAHRFFERFGFVKTGEEREMFDAIEPYREFYFYLDINPSAAKQ
ncbi:MAG: GNAT family N-acetyltransferase [Pirellulaceae bacterium]